MKRILFPLVILVLLLSGCETVPFADFTASSTTVQPMDVITFHNNSSNASSFQWNFGDGYSSTVFNPQHSYTNEGTYTVTLTARGNGKISAAHMTIDVYYTVLEVTVAEWNQNYVHSNVIPNATVILYPTLYDWDNGTNEIIRGTTDANGVVDFSGLDPVDYYLYVYNNYYDNFQLRNDDPGYVTAGPLTPFVINQFTAWVDYDPQQSAARPGKNIQVPKINTSKHTYIKVDVSK